MKNIFLFLVLIGNNSFAQTTVEGSITSFPNTQFTIKINQSTLNENRGKLVATGTTDDKGRFNTTIDIKSEQPVLLFIGNLFFSLWAGPNTTVGIWENPNAQYSFSGATAIENKILFQSGLMQPYKTPENVGVDFFNPDKQLAYLDSIEMNRLQILNTITNDNVVSKKFQSYYKAQVYSYTAFNKNQYPVLCKGSKKITDKDIPGEYFNFWNRFKLESDSTASSYYQNALQSYIEYKALEKTGKSKAGTEQAWHEMFRTTDSLLQDYPLCLQKQKTGYLLLLIRYSNLNNFTASELDLYKRQFPQSSSIAFLEKLWNKKVGSESSIPSFQLKNTNGELVDIKDFRGKVVYIDFWGSWCKACLANMLHATELKARFKNKNVIFLYIDFDDTKENWTEAIKKYNIEGIHLKTESSDKEYFDRVFNVNSGFPRYALIDKEGKLITMSAPPPQSPSTQDLIQKYLNE